MKTLKRIRDIIASNINSALDKAEDPEKMIDLSIKEAEETIASLRKSIAENKADRLYIEKKIIERKETISRWNARAELAVKRGRDDMAREAIAARIAEEKNLASDNDTVASLDTALASLNETLTKATDRLHEMKAKSASIKAQGKAAKERMKANAKAERYAADMERFSEIEKRIARWESYSDTYVEKKPSSFEELERDEEIEKELEKLKGETASA